MTTQNPAETGEQIKEQVRAHYARAISSGSSCCGGPGPADGPGTTQLLEVLAYTPEQIAAVPADLAQSSFGCGNPLAQAGIQPGQTVLDIGSGAGLDAFLAARQVGPAGHVIGLDMTPAMIERAQANAVRQGITNVEFRLGDAEEMPVADASVDWIISNCVINLAPDKDRVFAEAYRVLKPGGQVSISDIVTGDLPDPLRRIAALWAGCVAGALPEEEYLEKIQAAGFVEVEVAERETYDLSGQSSCLDQTTLQQVSEVVAQLPPQLRVDRLIWSARILARKPE